MATRMYNPPHPGEALREWLGDMSVTETAEALKVSSMTLSKILNGKNVITADMALRLSQWLGSSPVLWMGCKISSTFGMPDRQRSLISNH